MEEFNNTYNRTELYQLVPSPVLDVFLVAIAITNLVVFTLSVGWLVKICLETTKLRKMIQTINKIETTEEKSDRMNNNIRYRRNLILIAVLIVEALHLVLKGIGFAIFFIFKYINNQDLISDCSRLNGYSTEKSFRYFPITLVRLGLTNALILSLVLLLSIVMVYLAKAYNEHKDFSILKKYLIFGIFQFVSVWITVSILWTAFEGSIIFSIFAIINCIIIFKSRNELSQALTKWKQDLEEDFYEDMAAFLKREKIVKRCKQWMSVLVISTIIYLISVILDSTGNWIFMISSNPCMVSTIFGMSITELSDGALEIAFNLSSVLFLISNITTLQFDLFLILSNLAYFINKTFYINFAYQDKAIRKIVKNMVHEHQRLLQNYNVV